jgi:phospholipid/cholesterol/gamma-HCH transport system substrate-binding protein
MRTLEGNRRIRNGTLGIILALCVVAVGQTFADVPMLFAQPIYYGQFSDAAGITRGDRVRVSGIDVGQVTSLANEGDHISLGFTLGGQVIGTDSHLAIRTDTILGKRVVEIDPRGTQPLRAGQVLPIGQNTTPYQIYDAYFDATKVAAGWDVDTITRSLDVLAQTVDQTSPHLSAALDGVARFSDTIGRRDEQVKALLGKAHKVVGILGERRDQINELLVDSNSLLSAFNSHSEAIGLLLGRITAVSDQLQGVLNDNPNVNTVLTQLRTVSDLLVKHKDHLADVLTTLANFSAALGEAVSSGPYFNTLVVNLLPGQVLQPFVDSAFKRRGIDPEQFWRNAGLPAFQFPDPNGSRFANGAPPPAPPVGEGTPELPGPAVAPGSPCSYTPAADGLPRPPDPLPCAALDQGPYGPVPGGYPPPDVTASLPNPAALPPSPGIPVAGVPGQPPPDAPGTSVPLPPAPPGARTDMPTTANPGG